MFSWSEKWWILYKYHWIWFVSAGKVQPRKEDKRTGELNTIYNRQEARYLANTTYCWSPLRCFLAFSVLRAQRKDPFSPVPVCRHGQCMGKGNARLNCLVSLPDSTRERNLAELESQNLWIQSQRTMTQIFVFFYCKPIHDRYFYCKPIHDRYLISVLIPTYKLEANTQTLFTSTTTTPLCRPANSTPYRKSTTTDPPILNFYLTIRSWALDCYRVTTWPRQLSRIEIKRK